MLLLLYNSKHKTEQGRRKLFYGGGLVKISATMVAPRRKVLKLHW